MQKKRNIRLGPILLLLIYAISILPVAVFHHHHEENSVAYEEATLCEKNIYYDMGSHNCGHTKHISKKSEKCSLCDQHSILLYVVKLSTFKFLNYSNVIENNDFYESLIAKYSALFFNKGPPII